MSALDVDRARAAAAAADKATASGAAAGVLHGLPMTVKDVYETEGLVTTSGAPELKDHIPTTDALAVGRLKQAGAIIFGKSNTPIYAGDLQTYNDVFGRTNNPWDTSRTTGGSSGGSAAAIAAGLSPLELGSDIGGSIRNPAHFNGVYGIKSSWGVVPSRGHIPGSTRQPDRDRRQLQRAAGPQPGRPPPRPRCYGRTGSRGRRGLATRARPRRADRRRLLAADRHGLRRWRLPPADRGGGPRHPGRLRGPRRRRQRQGRAGAAPREPRRRVPRRWQDLVLPIIGTGLSDDEYAAFTPLDSVEGDDPAINAGRAMVSRYRTWLIANAHRQHQRAAWAGLFERYDAVLAPVMSTAAFPHDTERSFMERTLDVDGTAVPHFMLIAWCGAIGAMLLPVVTLPAGRTPSGLPVGVQVIGPFLSDARLLCIAEVLDQAAGPGFTPPPTPA